MAQVKTEQCKPRLSLALLTTVLLALPACPALTTVEGDGVQTQNVTLTYLRRTLKALEGAFEFFQQQYDKVNLDAVIGTRIVEGSLKVLLANLQQTHVTDLLPSDVMTSIRALYDVAKRVSDEAEPHVARSQPRYYHRIGPAIHEGLWELNYTRRTIPVGEVAVWSYVPLEAMTEAQSDDCLTELFGTTGKTEETCAISDTCWVRMMSFGYSRYSLSHQIFYLQIAEKSGCVPELLWKAVEYRQGSLQTLKDTFCANMLREALSIARDNYPAPHQDLFMEQAALCGLYGYWQFFRYDWLDTILSWQDEDQGCFRWAGWPLERMDGAHHHITKREERRLDNGCLCHRTTVAAGALAQYIRFLAEGYIHDDHHDKIEIN